MPNNTGLVFGRITKDGASVAKATVDINFIMCEGAVRYGANDSLSSNITRTETNDDGRYILPFFWDSTNGNVIGGTPTRASMLGIEFVGNQRVASSNKRGRLFLTVDVRRLFGVVAAPIPTSVPELADVYKDFHAAYRSMLPKGGTFLKVLPFSTEVFGLVGEIDIDIQP